MPAKQYPLLLSKSSPDELSKGKIRDFIKELESGSKTEDEDEETNITMKSILL